MEVFSLRLILLLTILKLSLPVGATQAQLDEFTAAVSKFSSELYQVTYFK